LRVYGIDLNKIVCKQIIQDTMANYVLRILPINTGIFIGLDTNVHDISTHKLIGTTQSCVKPDIFSPMFKKIRVFTTKPHVFTYTHF
jgi:hypothetical protein